MKPNEPSTPFKFLAHSDQGPRDSQQDAFGHLIGDWGLLAVVSDGAGGHRGGRQAADATVAALIEGVSARIDELQALWKEVEPSGSSEGADGGKSEADFRERLGGVLTDAIREAHNRVAKLGESPKLSPKATAAALLIFQKMGAICHVGDSRVYRLDDGKIVSRTKDHTMVQIFHDKGEVAEEDMGTHPDQGRLLRALGAEDAPKVSVETFPVGEKESYLLCSDGFWERILRREMEGLFAGGISDVALARLAGRAVKRNGPKGDNVTVAVVFSSSFPPPGSSWDIVVAVLLGIAILVGVLFFDQIEELLFQFLRS